MKRVLFVAVVVFAFAMSGAAAGAYYGWRATSAPCVPTEVSVTSDRIAVICPGDQHVYLQDR